MADLGSCLTLTSKLSFVGGEGERAGDSAVGFLVDFPSALPALTLRVGEGEPEDSEDEDDDDERSFLIGFRPGEADFRSADLRFGSAVRLCSGERE